MPALTKNKIRAKCNVAAPGTSWINQLTNSNPNIWRGMPVDIEFAAFEGDSVYDITDLTIVTAEFHDGSFRLSPRLAYASTSDFDVTLTADEWTAKTNQHGTISLTAADTNLDLEGDPFKDFWLVLYGLNSDNEKVIFGGAVVRIHESGVGETSTAPSQGGTIVEPGAVYDVSGEFEVDVVQDRKHDFVLGNATSLDNGAEVLSASGRFTSVGTTVILHGTPAATVTAVLRYPISPTFDEMSAAIEAAVSAVLDKGKPIILRNDNGLAVMLTVAEDGRFITHPIDPTA